MPHSHENTDALTTTRVEALQDGVFAIVMTLLVLELKIPELHDGHELGAYLQTLWPVFFAYVASFVNLGIYWVGQHNQFHWIRATDRILLWINIGFLCLIALLPFTTALLGRYGDTQIPYVLYGLNLIAIGVVSYFHWCYAATYHRLTSHDVTPAFDRAIKRRILVAPIVSVVAILLSFLSPMFSLVLYFLLPVYYIWPARFDSFWKTPAVPHED